MNVRPFGLENNAERELYANIRQMYINKDTNIMNPFMTSTQKSIFEKEISTLNRFGLHKEFNYTPQRNDYANASSSYIKPTDGKVDLLFLTSAGSVSEIYKNDAGRKIYSNKIRNAFIESVLLKTNLKLEYENREINCKNCGSILESIGENFICRYCDAHYSGEASSYLLSRFNTAYALKGCSKVFYILIPIIIIAVLYESKLINKELYENISTAFSLAVGSIVTLLFVAYIIYASVLSIRHYSALGTIRRRDKHFSLEILTKRVSELLQLHTDQLLDVNSPYEAKLFKKLNHLYIKEHIINETTETLRLTCKVEYLHLKKRVGRVKVSHKDKKYEFIVFRSAGTLSKAYYTPDQFSCYYCGSHSMLQNSLVQRCVYCQRETPMEYIDWIFV